MQLLRVGQIGREIPAARLIDPQGTTELVDLRPLIDDITPETLSRENLLELQKKIAYRRGDLRAVERTGMRIGAPLSRIGKIVCVGLNYRKHAAEAGMSVPTEPVLFMKAADTVVGPNDTVTIPLGSTQTDYEVELAVIIGTEASYLADDDNPLDYIAGFAISNDVSEREFQLERGGQWDKGKNAAGFNPLGPWLVTPDEIPDPQRVQLTTKVNEEVRQNSSTADMIFSVSYLIRYISQFMTLYPGDIINTGTPEGVGSGFTPGKYLQAGDCVDISVTGLGVQSQKFQRYERTER